MFIALILLLSAVLRLFDLGKLPISLFGDEIDVGYHAWSLFTSLKDYSGRFLPLYIKSLAEFRAPVLMYISAPFVGFFGPSAFSVRLGSAVMGLLSIYLLYYLVNLIFPKRQLGVVAALFLSLTPWHIHYSRAAFEVTTLMALVLLGAITFIKKKYILSSIFFCLTIYTYSTAVVFTPLFAVLLFFTFRPLKTSNLILPIIVTLFLMTPFFLSLKSGESGSRFSSISILSDQKVIDSIIIARTYPWIISDKFTVFLHNKPLAFTRTFFDNYLKALSPNFLFVSGDPEPRHNPGFGLLPLVFLPLILLGLNRFLVLWLLLSAIPSSLTQGGGDHATRLFLMIPPLILLATIGFDRLKKSKYFPHLRMMVFLFLVANAVYFFSIYAREYRYQSARSWQYGYEQVFTALGPRLSNAPAVYVNNSYEPSLLRFALFTKLRPVIFRGLLSSDTVVDNFIDGFDGYMLGDNYYFGRAKNFVGFFPSLPEGSLFIVVQGQEVPGDWDWSVNPPSGIKTLYTVRDQFNQSQFYLLESVKKQTK